MPDCLFYQLCSRLRFLKCVGPILVMVLSLIIENAGKYYVVDANDKSTPVFKDVGPVKKGELLFWDSSH